MIGRGLREIYMDFHQGPGLRPKFRAFREWVWACGSVLWAEHILRTLDTLGAPGVKNVVVVRDPEHPGQFITKVINPGRPGWCAPRPTGRR